MANIRTLRNSCSGFSGRHFSVWVNDRAIFQTDDLEVANRIVDLAKAADRHTTKGMCVVDYKGRKDENFKTITEDSSPAARFGVPHSRHVSIYNLKVIWRAAS